jgi:hypothetical protein
LHNEGQELNSGRTKQTRFGLSLGAALAVASGIAVAQTPLGDLYIEAAAVAEKCGTPALDQNAIAKLAALISAETKVPMSAADTRARLGKARAAMGGTIDCAGPFTAIHVQFFNNVMLPRMGGQAPPPGSELSSTPP